MATLAWTAGGVYHLNDNISHSTVSHTWRYQLNFIFTAESTRPDVLVEMVLAGDERAFSLYSHNFKPP
jgi:hypothetical protein